MKIELSEEQLLIKSEIRRFAEDVIAPGVSERDKNKQFPSKIIEQLGKMGYLGMTIPSSYGGSELDIISYLVVIEEIARICPSTAVTVSVTNSVCAYPIVHFGSDELKREVLPKLASGEAIGGFALTEPEAGSDAASIKTVAFKDGDYWVLNGEKAWITNAGVGKYFVVFAKTSPEKGRKGISSFVVSSDNEGFRVGKAEDKLGLRSSVTAPIFFENCKVHKRYLLGKEGEGFSIAMSTLNHSRLGIAAQAVGIHQRALELAISYAKERIQFGKPIAAFQDIQFKIATMATELEASRALTYLAALESSSSNSPRFSSQAKLFATEAANRACYTALQIHGGNGFSEEYEIAKLYRDVRVTTIYEGTSEMQRTVISKSLFR